VKTSGKPAGRFRLRIGRLKGLDGVPAAGLVLVALFFFRKVLWQGGVFFFRDFSFYFYPKSQVVTERIRNFDLPFWNRLGGCGEPVLGAWQSAIFYPPALIYYLFERPWSYMWFVALHPPFSGLGMYLFVRSLGARRPAAAVAAAAWGFSPVFLSTLDTVSFMTTLAWLPWCLFFTRRLCLRHSFPAFSGLTVTFATAVLAGGPEPVVFIAATAAAYAAAAFVGGVVRVGRGKSWRGPLAVLGALALAAVICAVQLAPFARALAESGRVCQEVEAARRWSAGWSSPLLCVLPRFGLYPDRGGIYWPGQTWLKTFYMGAAVPFLAVWTVVFVRRRRAIFFAAMAAAGAVLALGEASAVWTFLWRHLPGFSLIRYPVKWFVPAAFAMAVLAGLAVDDLAVCTRAGLRRRGILPAGVLLAALVFAAGLVATWADEGWARGVLEPSETIGAKIGEAEAAWRAEARLEAARWSLGRSALFLALTAAALAAWLPPLARKVPRGWGAAAIAGVILLDAGLFSRHLNPVTDASFYTEKPAHLTLAPKDDLHTRLYTTPALRHHLFTSRMRRMHGAAGLQAFLAGTMNVRMESSRELVEWAAEKGAPRFRTVNDLDSWLEAGASAQFMTLLNHEVFREVLHPNINMLHGVSAVYSFEPLMGERHRKILDAVREGRAGLEARKHLRDLWAVSVVIDLAEGSPPFTYLGNTRPSPRAVLAYRVRAAADEKEALEALLDPRVDPLTSIILEGRDAEAAARHLGADGPAVPARDPAHAMAKIMSDTGDEVTVKVAAARPALLFMSDNWYPNFRATVDGEPAPVWRANYAYRAVPVGAGSHVVRLSYRPSEFYLGAAVTAAGFTGFIVIGLLWRKRR